MSSRKSMLLLLCRRQRQQQHRRRLLSSSSSSSSSSSFPSSPASRPLLASETHTAGGRGAGAGGSDPPAPPPSTTNVLLIHGLLGSGRNWRSVARALAAGAAERAAEAVAAAAPSSPPPPSSSSPPAPPRVCVTAVDLRCHGATNSASMRSRELAFAPPHDISSAAADVNAFANATFGSPSALPAPAAPDVLIGHSIGGKVALEAARQSLVSAAPLPRQLWVLDSPLSARRHDDAGPASRRAKISSSPGKRPMAPGATAAVLSVVQSVPREALRSRRAAERWLIEVEKVPSAVAAWLCSQLVPRGGGGAEGGTNNGDELRDDSDSATTTLTWAFDPRGASSLFESYQLLDAWPLLRCPPVGLDLRVVVGGRSDRWSQAERRRLEEAEKGAAANAAPAPAPDPSDSSSDSSDSPIGQGTLKVHLLPKAGHWVHVDDQEGLLALLVPAVAEVAARKALQFSSSFSSSSVALAASAPNR